METTRARRKGGKPKQQQRGHHTKLPETATKGQMYEREPRREGGRRKASAGKERGKRQKCPSSEILYKGWLRCLLDT